MVLQDSDCPLGYLKFMIKENLITKGDGKHVWQIEEQGDLKGGVFSLGSLLSYQVWLVPAINF